MLLEHISDLYFKFMFIIFKENNNFFSIFFLKIIYLKKKLNQEKVIRDMH